MFEDLAPGDVIALHRTLEVTQKHSGGIYVRDVRSGFNDFISPRDSATYFIVSKAEPPRYKPKVGDIVTGRELFDLPWPVGTVVKSQSTGWTYIKHQDNWRGPYCILPSAQHAGHTTNYTILDISTRGNSNG